MKSKHYIFDIENPCNENWDKMTANEAGKFCDSCAKTVIDFTKLSDSQIIKIIQKSSQNVCGRMREDQLHREMYPINEKSPKSFLYKILASFILFFGTIKTYSNKLPKTQTENVNKFQNIVEENPTTNDTIKRKLLRGKIIDFEKIPLKNIRIKLKNTVFETISDSLGRFKILIPDSLITMVMTLELSDEDQTFQKYIYKLDFDKYNTLEFSGIDLPNREIRKSSIMGGGIVCREFTTYETPKPFSGFNLDFQIDTRPLKDR